MYSSKDLYSWRDEGAALVADVANPNSDISADAVIERPKVLYSRANDEYVMWFHVDDAAYRAARLGVAVSRTPVGPFTYLGSERPHGSEESRDFTVWQDPDPSHDADSEHGSRADEKMAGAAAGGVWSGDGIGGGFGRGPAYLLYSSEGNAVMHVARLTPDLRRWEPAFERILVGQFREAPAVFKRAGLYYLLTSGCSGWRPNPQEVHVASAMMGAEWFPLGEERTVRSVRRPTNLPNSPPSRVNTV